VVLSGLISDTQNDKIGLSEQNSVTLDNKIGFVRINLWHSKL